MLLEHDGDFVLADDGEVEVFSAVWYAEDFLESEFFLVEFDGGFNVFDHDVGRDCFVHIASPLE